MRYLGGGRVTYSNLTVPHASSLAYSASSSLWPTASYPCVVPRVISDVTASASLRRCGLHPNSVLVPRWYPNHALSENDAHND